MSSQAPAPATRTTGSHRRQFRHYLLDRGIQLRYIVFVMVLSAGLCAAFGFLIWQQKNFATQTIIDGINRVDWIDPDMKAEIGRTLRAGDLGIVKRMAVAAIGLMVVMMGFLTVMTHRVAGPLYKIGTFFEAIRDGKLTPVYDLRRGDQFQDFFEHFKGMNNILRQKTQRDIEVYRRFLGAWGDEVSPELRAKLDALKALADERHASLT